MTRRVSGVAALWALAILGPAFARADDGSAAPASDAPTRPKIAFNRWQEDWSVLADPKLRTEPLDFLKYVPLSSTDPHSYLSLGLNVRERFESNDAPAFGVGDRKGDSYLLDRVQIHADLRPDSEWQLFVQLEDVRAPWKDVLTPVDENRVDLRQAFAAYVHEFADGVLKLRFGRQEMAFDLQRFVSVRDGPNVRQAYDALWADWELGMWRVIGFWSRPVQYRTEHAFDDFSRWKFQYGGARIETRDLGPGELSVYYSHFKQDDVQYLDAAGNESRDILDARYAGTLAGFDWDLEGMGQLGRVGDKDVHAWAIGARSGYTFGDEVWRPRLGLQVDAASGDTRPGNGTLGTFNPLFPNGYYFTLGGFTGYANLVHVKPSLTVRPLPTLSVMLALALQWRETVADAIYVQPDVPVAGTAGRPGSFTGMYEQLRADWLISANLSAAVEAVHFDAGQPIRRAGGHDGDYLGIELKLGF